MKLLFISTMNGSPWGGSEELWHKTALYALSERIEVSVCTQDWEVIHPKIQKLISSGASVSFRKRSNTLIRRISDKFLPPKPTKIFLNKKEIPDAILISLGSFVDLAYDRELSVFLTNIKIPYTILVQHNFEHYVLGSYEIDTVCKIIENCKQILFVSERNMLTAQRQLAMKIPRSKIVSNPQNLTTFSIKPFPVMNSLNFATVARLSCVSKGQDILLEVLSDPFWRKIDWQLNLYGDGPDKEYLKRLSVFYGIAQRVRFCGVKEDIESIWENNHIHVLPSFNEGTPLALIESLICGRPAVVTDVGDNARYVKDESTGFIAAAPTTEIFFNTLKKAVNNKEYWKDYGIKAHYDAVLKIDKTPEGTLLNLLLN
jgi:L-malate glycosyltransferase